MIIGDDRAGPLTDPARVLLLTHEPGVWAYLSRAFGRPAGPSDLVAVDAAYVELAFGGLVAQVDATFTVLAGERRRPFVLTPAGERARTASDTVPLRMRMEPGQPGHVPEGAQAGPANGVERWPADPGSDRR